MANGAMPLEGFTGKWGSRAGIFAQFSQTYWLAADPSRFSGQMYYPLSYDNFIMLGADSGDANVITPVPAFTTTDALWIDTKLDDGHPLRGKMIATKYWGDYCATNYASNYTTIAVDAAYDLTKKDRECALILRHFF